MPEQWGLSRVCALCCPFAPALALVAPPGTPEAIAQQINAAVVEALKLPEVQKRFLDQGLKPAGGAEAAAFITGETARWQKVIRSANIRLE